MRFISISFTLLFGVTILWLASSLWGIGYDPDSIIYEDVAENWLAGDGISRFDFATGDTFPMTNFPPLYPLILGIISQLTGTVAAAARVLNTGLWAVLWLLVYAWIRRDNQARSIAWMGAGLLMLNLFIFQVFGTSWSEPLFLVLGFGGLWLFTRYYSEGQSRYLISTGILFACAILTRYAGIALVATACMVLLTTAEYSWRKRLTTIAGLGLISGMPLLLWLLRNISVRGDVANRDVGFTLIGLPQLDSTIRTVGSWLLPIPEVSLNIAVIMVILVLVVWTMVQTRRPEATSDILMMTVCWWILIYLLFIIASFTFLDPRIPFNYRILLPAYVGLMIVVGRYLANHWDQLSRWLRIIWVITGLALLMINGLLSVNWAVIIGNNGQQYSSSSFQQSQLLDDLRVTSLSDTILYTNNNFLLHYQTGKAAQVLPSPDAVDWQVWQEELPDNTRVQIVFFSILSQRNWDSTDQLKSLLPLSVVQESDVVSLYELEQLNE